MLKFIGKDLNMFMIVFTFKKTRAKLPKDHPGVLEEDPNVA